jgi:hypothetical protein
MLVSILEMFGIITVSAVTEATETYQANLDKVDTPRKEVE